MRQTTLPAEEDSKREQLFTALQIVLCRHLKDENFLRIEHLHSSQK